MNCERCPNTGTIGVDMTLRRDGMVPGTRGMARYYALCHDCIKAGDSTADEYTKQSQGE